VFIRQKFISYCIVVESSRPLYNLQDPCKNCKGPTVCLDGQVLLNTPGHGTMIRAVKDTSYIIKNTEVKVVADDFGTVDTVRWDSPVVKWNTLGNYFCDDFTEFVYKCK